MDAIAEKLCQTREIPFFVYGNTERLSLLAKEWTLDKQVDRDPRVVVLTQRLKRVRALSDALSGVVAYHLNRRFGPGSSHDRRRMALVDRRFGRDSVLSDPIHDRIRLEKEAWLARDPWRMWWMEHWKEANPALMKWSHTAHDRTVVLGRQLAELKAQVHKELVNAARAILCTVATASRTLLTDEDVRPAVSKVTTAILDEAGTAPEPKLPLLALLPQLTRVIAIGDHKQLPPFTRWKANGGGGGSGSDGQGVCRVYAAGQHCRWGSRCKFKHTRSASSSSPRRSPTGASDDITSKGPTGFFQRLQLALPTGAVPTLTSQYRMHHVICGFISDRFYGGQLVTPPAVAAARTAADPIGLWWVEYASSSGSGFEEKPHPKSTSPHNPTEAAIVTSVLRRCREGPAGARKSIMVITYYKSQEKLLRQTLADAGFHETTGTDGGLDGAGSLRVTTVDQAQGSEADVVIKSCVRSNPEGTLGFVSMTHRLNVGASRARERLVVVGDHKTLCSDANYRELHSSAQKVSRSSVAVDLPLLM